MIFIRSVAGKGTEVHTLEVPFRFYSSAWHLARLVVVVT